MALFVSNHAFYDKRWRKKSCTCKFYMYCLWHNGSILDTRLYLQWILFHTLSVCNALLLYCIVQIVELFSKACIFSETIGFSIWTLTTFMLTARSMHAGFRANAQQGGMWVVAVQLPWTISYWKALLFQKNACFWKQFPCMNNTV